MILRKLRCGATGPAFIALLMMMASANSAVGVEVTDRALALQRAIDQGPADPHDEITVTIHLKSPDKAAFDKAVEELYNPASPSYEHWMTDAQLQMYAPTPAAMLAVKAEVSKNGLSVLSVDPLGFSLRVHGTVADVQRAFQTELHQYTLNKSTFRAHAQPARLTGGADVYVRSVSGLDSRHIRPMLKRALNPRTEKAPPPVPLSRVKESAGGLSSIVTDNCFSGPGEFTFKTPGTPLPTGVYFGNVYNNTIQTCSFTSSQLQSHYGLPAAYAEGLNGAGQTIVLVEGYGYPTIEEDANAFSALNGLPTFNSSNFEIVYPEGKPKDPNAGVLLGWDVEIALDIQWSHSIAPNAKIIVVAAAGQDSETFQNALNYVVNNHLGYSVSNSWEEDVDLIAGPDELASYDAVLEKAAAKGVSVNFSSGDSGDEGLGSPIGAPGVPADSPYATAVGGTAILNKFYGSNLEVGWGNGLTLIDEAGPVDPPLQIGFVGGAGGGESIQYPKPSWQSALPGTGRQVPDISALADPNTGVFIVLTDSGTQYIEAGWGGTSLACPIFSAFWAIADQSAKHPLGQAAPRVARATGNEVTDIVPHSSPTNPAGIIIDSFGANYYSPSALLSETLAAGTATEYISAIWPIPASPPYPEEHLVIGFGLDSSLTVTPGWDNVTGFGVPNGLAFIKGFK